MAKTKGSDLAVRGGSDLATMEPWEQALAERAKNEKAAEVVGIPRITHRGGILKLDDKPIAGNKLRCGIIGYCFTKAFYEKGFDPDEPAATPVCYAHIMPEPGCEALMVPHTAAPTKNHPECKSCPHNVFGTADKGRGKRCRDIRRVLVICETKDKNSVLKAQVRQIDVPPGSLRNWGNFLGATEEVSPLGVRGVLTEISTQPLEKGAYTLTFLPVEKLGKETVQAMAMLEEKHKAGLMAPFPVINRDESPKKNGKAKKRPSVE